MRTGALKTDAYTGTVIIEICPLLRLPPFHNLFFFAVSLCVVHSFTAPPKNIWRGLGGEIAGFARVLFPCHFDQHDSAAETVPHILRRTMARQVLQWPGICLGSMGTALRFLLDVFYHVRST